MDEEVLCEISKFAENTKMANLVNSRNDIRLMLRTVDKLVTWANKWDMDFNVKKVWSNAYRKKKFRVPLPDE